MYGYLICYFENYIYNIYYLLNNLYTYETYTILIPIKTIIGYEEEGKMNFIYANDNIVSIDYNSFIYKNSIIER